MSEESTLWALPSTSVTRMSTTGYPRHAPFHLGPHALLHTRDELPRHRPADHLVDELESGARGQRLHLDVAHRILAVAAGLLDVPAVSLRGPTKVSRNGIRTSTESTFTP